MEPRSLQVKPNALTIEKNSTLIEAFIVACEQLDISMLETLIHEDDVFEEKDKWDFLVKFRNRFNMIKAEGVDRLIRGKSICEICIRGAKVVTFADAKSKSRFGLIFDEKDGVLADVFECNVYMGRFEDGPLSERMREALRSDYEV